MSDEENTQDISAEEEQATEEEVDSPVSADLDAALNEILKASKSKKVSEAFETMHQVLSGLSDEDFALIADSPQLSELIRSAAIKAKKAEKPGDPVYAGGRQIGKVPYTMEYVKKMFPMVSWIPTRTTSIGYNGVTIWVEALKEIETPACFRDIFFQSERDTAAAYANARNVLQQTGAADGVSLEVGWRKMSDEELLSMQGNRVI